MRQLDGRNSSGGMCRSTHSFSGATLAKSEANIFTSGSMVFFVFRDGDFLVWRAGDLRFGDDVLALAARAGLFFFAGDAAGFVLRRDGEDLAVPAEAAERAADRRGDRRRGVVTPISVRAPNAAQFVLLFDADGWKPNAG